MLPVCKQQQRVYGKTEEFILALCNDCAVQEICSRVFYSTPFPQGFSSVLLTQKNKMKTQSYIPRPGNICEIKMLYTLSCFV